jgi:hypothetical protein
MTDSPKHPNATTDPGCTNIQALEEALQSKIAAELYHRIIDALRSSAEQKYLASDYDRLLLAQIEVWRDEIETKYKPLRELIGLTGGTKDAT